MSQFKVDQILADAEGKVKDFIEAKFRAEADGVAWKPRVALGRVSEEIVVAAFQEEVDLIVMGRCKRRTLARLLRSSIRNWSARAPRVRYSLSIQLNLGVVLAGGGCLY